MVEGDLEIWLLAFPNFVGFWCLSGGWAAAWRPSVWSVVDLHGFNSWRQRPGIKAVDNPNTAFCQIPKLLTARPRNMSLALNYAY